MAAARNDGEQIESIRQWRLRQIFTAREHVRDTMLRVEEECALGDLSQDVGRLFAYRSVQQYIREAETLLRPDESPPSDDDGNYRPDQDSRQLPGDHDWWWLEPVGEFDLPGPQRYRAGSLNSFYAMDVPLEVTWTEVEDQGVGGREEVTKRGQVYPPRRISFDAARIVDRGLADVGLEIDVMDNTKVIGGPV